MRSKEDLKPSRTLSASVGSTPDEDERERAKRSVYVETYGCQMNVNDSEVMMSVLESAGYDETKEVNEADVILVNTCAIRDKAEAKIWQRLAYFRSLGNGKKRSERPVVGVLGCMAERIKEKLCAYRVVPAQSTTICLFTRIKRRHISIPFINGP